ncbi:MAG: elongation factor G [Anaerolineae bacterium]
MPLQVPIGQSASFKGVYRLISKAASLGPEGKDGEAPADVLAEADGMREQLVEAAAEGDDDLIIKFLDGEALTPDEIRHGLQEGAKAGRYVPVYFTAATNGTGVHALMHQILTTAPSPLDARPVAAERAGKAAELTASPSGPLAVRVFKTMADPYVGKLQYLRVVSGTLGRRAGVEREPVRGGAHRAVVRRARQGADDGRAARGGRHRRRGEAAPHAHVRHADGPRRRRDAAAGGAAAAAVRRGASPGVAGGRRQDRPVPAAHGRGGPTYRTEVNENTHELTLSGMGEGHIDVAVRQLKDKFGVKVSTTVPKVPQGDDHPHRLGAVPAQKQTGGAGQFAEVHLRVEPAEEGRASYASAIVGGAISHSFIPSIEKGIRQVLPLGVIAACPVIDVKAIVYDGKEHPVDSKDIAFQIAGREAFKAAVKEAGPVLLEPVFEVTVVVPAGQVGDILSDMNTRRGMVQGTEQIGNKAVVKAQVPLAEIQRYATDLRSLTQGRGYYTAAFSHYARMPHQAAEAVIAERSKDLVHHDD